jgi:hypothetical protein
MFMNFVYFLLKDENQINFRLPTDIKPLLYEMKIKSYVGPPSLYGSKSFTFEGTSNITFVCIFPTNKIILHIKDIMVKQTKVFSLDSSIQLHFNGKLEFDDEKDFLIIGLDNKCAVNRYYKLELIFEGIIAETLYGFYRSSYVDSFDTTH